MASSLIAEILSSALLIAVSGLLLEALSRLLQAILRRGGARTTTIRATRDALRVLWLVLVAGGIIWIWGFAPEINVLTISGIAGLAVTLALQSVLSNMIAGFLLLRDGALRIGDRIEYGGSKGVVIRIGLRNTWIRTVEGSVAIVGNSALAGGPLTNHTAAIRMADELGAPAQPVGPSPSNQPDVPAP
ncbi:MAG: mechanosensitive ion channel family protein [Thermoplasmata archaeon]|nr:mechanosensitive ion channel family protein [Thermoplasmata archaeon]